MKRIQYYRYGGPEEMQLEATRGLKIGALSIPSPYACRTGLSYFPCKIWRFDPENPY
jgi:hypothetical protein